MLLATPCEDSMTQEEALEEINSFLKSKNVKSVKGKIRWLKTLTGNEDPEIVRLSQHMLKYAEQENYDTEFSKFLNKDWVRVSKKRPHRLSRAEVKKAEEEFRKAQR